MAALSGISDLPLFRRRGTGNHDEIEALLDLLPHPTLIADERNGRIFFANSQATQLSAFTRKELRELELSTLLPDLDTGQMTEMLSNGRGPQAQTLITRSSKRVEIALSLTPLGGQEHWAAVVLGPTTLLEDEGADQTRAEERWHALSILAVAAQQAELASSYRQILQAGKLLTGAGQLALYTPDENGQALRLEAVGGSGLDFPPVIESSEVRKLSQVIVWQAGKAIESSLHKLGREAKLNFLATAPLYANEPARGLIVAADPRIPPPEDLAQMMAILAASAATAETTTQHVGHLAREVEELAQSHSLSQSLQANMQDGLLLLDTKLAIEGLNANAERILGFTREEAAGRGVSEVLLSNQTVVAEVDAEAKSGEGKDLGELKLFRRDGSEFLANVRVAPIRAGEQTQRVAVLISDMSENEALHVRSQQLQQRAWLGEVTAIFAHEVRNPINNISTGLQLMKMDLAEDDPTYEQIQKLQEDCDRLDHRMKSVLSFSRSMEHKPEPIDMGEFCRMQLERWRSRMARHHIEQHLQVAEDTPEVMGDRRALDQVFTNLITNAIQAMQDQGNGVLAIKVKPADKSKEGGYVDVHISDSGPGIPEDLRERVFDPFFTTKANEGTGLGLAITKRIIMAHKGEISLESFPGGTLFKLKLPAA